ncbi:hypothetical protein IMCC1989_169 [gamma proteobacterium IMCC1989]|nr:hypothetical protein IMCC1989_169 [gamma proteobacterium IMCC1989]
MTKKSGHIVDMWRKGRNHVELLYLAIVLLLAMEAPFIK